MDTFCCVTGQSFLDVWTIVHLAFWIFIGSCLWAWKFQEKPALIACFLLALLWEVFEYFIAFRFWPNVWLDPESFLNSLVSDPLTCLVGFAGIWAMLDHRKRR